ncbi:MAG: hypothetical protein CVU48_10615 [Candidatus Cloacimonetes bacterium HGW-Cloacimonetes-1]|jgi:hypothetical protein|nr:MAG: hypothetical protein CVU48_10615 [Candidatus Cloacimonetes bacterium HGW-Cloacimonetes-1]
MKKIVLLAIFVTLVFSLMSVDAVAYISASKGKVELTRNTKAQKFKVGDLLQNNDEIRTGGESFAAYKFVDDSANIKVFPNSVVKITAMKSGTKLNKSVAVTKGSVLSKVKKNSGAFQVETPTTVASVRGTGFLTKVSEDQTTMIIVTEGDVIVEIKESGETRSVSAGNTAQIDEFGNVAVEASSPEDINDLEQAEIEADQEPVIKTMRIQVLDEQGNVKYIEITY